VKPADYFGSVLFFKEVILMKRLFVLILVLVMVLGINLPMATPVAASGGVHADFGEAYTLDIEGNSFTNGEVMGNTSWISGFTNNATSDVTGVGLTLATPLQFDWVSPDPLTMGPPIQWSFGDIIPGQHIDVNAGRPDKGVNVVIPGQSGPFTPGFDASRSANNTIFTGEGTQTLTIEVTTDQELPNLNYGHWFIGIGALNNGNVSSTITSWTADNSNGSSSNGSVDPNRQFLTISIENPAPGTHLIYYVNIQVTPLVPQVEFMPDVNVAWWQTLVDSATAPESSSLSHFIPDLGTWTWSTVGDYSWQWGEGLNRSVSFKGYSNSPNPPGSPGVDVAFSTDYACEVSGDSFINDNGPVTGNKDWASNLGRGIITLTNVNLNLDSNIRFNGENPGPTTFNGPDINGVYHYLWYFGNPIIGYPTGGTPWAQVGTFPAPFMPGFNASRSANQTTFITSGPQTLTVSVTPEENLVLPGGINIGVNVSEDQYINPTIESVTSPNGAPLDNIYPSPDGHSMRILISNPTKAITYIYTITIQLELKTGVTQLEFMPDVHVVSVQSEGNGSVTDTSSVSDTNDAGTWTWSSDNSITWNWNEVLNKGIYFQSYEAATITTPTSISSGGASVSQNNGVAVGITGSTAPGGTGVTISSTNYGSTQPTETGAIQLNGSPQYYDVSVSSTSGLGAGATAEISITSPSVTTNTIMQYWYNNQWNTATNISVSSKTITGDIPVVALTGTPLVIGSDTTPPSITISAPVNGAVYYLNQAVNANWNATDAGSGVATASGTVPSGSPINTSKVGSYSFTVSATDKAGNTATSTINYSVFGNAITALSGNINIGNSTNVTSFPGLSIGGNLFANGKISLGNTIKINGNATASGNITKGNNTTISGMVKPNAGVINFSMVNTSPYLAAVQLSKGGTVVNGASFANGGTISNAKTLMHGNLNLNNSKTLTINGDLYADSGSITIGSSSTLTINGNLFIANGSLIAGSSSKITVTGTVYMSGNLQAGTSATLSLGKVVWVGGGITLGNTSRMSGPQTIVSYSNIIFGNSNIIGNPQMQLIISTNGGISLGTSDQLYGYLYAPTAGVSIANSANVTGSIIAKSVTIGTSCLITYGGN
jgi:hypothetical protein